MASKSKTVYLCDECGYESPKWLGRCTSCGAWNSLKERKISVSPAGASPERKLAPDSKVVTLKSVTASNEERLLCGIGELDRVLGGGLVIGSLVLVGGDPGIGKSTLLLQTAGLMAEKADVLYISGEESEKQIKMRADRLGSGDKDIRLYCETNIDKILSAAENLKPDVMIIDSIQTVYSEEISLYPEA